jgi:succinoglycan biosynthesis protein ExoL
MSITIAYLVHDLGDAAVARRVVSISQGGGEVRLAGFHRRSPPAEVAGVRPLPLGHSSDAKLLQRAMLVIMVLLAPRHLASLVQGAHVIIARNLEMLVIASRLRQPGQRFVYECLDIHRIMLRGDLVGSAMRAIERKLLAQVDRIIVSSPAFERSYFRQRQHYSGPIDLVENKVAGVPAAPAAISPEEPWTIGWFGMLRCRSSLDLLGQMSAASHGRIKVLIAGIASPSIFPDFEREVAQWDGVEFAGSYNPEDLPRLYANVHFAWCIDYFEEGLNSRWLLPNRLYESIAHGAVPVALSGVETGRWLKDAGVGLTLHDGSSLGPLLAALDEPEYLALREAVKALPRSRIAFAPHDHQGIVARLAGLKAA